MHGTFDCAVHELPIKIPQERTSWSRVHQVLYTGRQQAIDAYKDRGTPDSRGCWRYLWWLVRRQLGRSAAGAVLASVWMMLLAATPCLMSKAIDEGLGPGVFPILAGWSGALFALGRSTRGWASCGTARCPGADGRQLLHGHGGRRVRGVAGCRAFAARGAGEVSTSGVGNVQTICQALTVVRSGVGAVAEVFLVREWKHACCVERQRAVGTSVTGQQLAGQDTGPGCGLAVVRCWRAGRPGRRPVWPGVSGGLR